MSAELRFIQVKRGALEGSRILARLLKVSRCHALGLLNLLWFWSDSERGKRHACHAGVRGHFSDRDPAELLSAALEHDGDPRALLDALVRSGFVEMFSETCGRVRGTSIYADLERKREQARLRKERQREREKLEQKQASSRSRSSRSSHATDPEASGLDVKGQGAVIHRPDLFSSSPVQASSQSRAPEIEGRVVSKPRLAAKRAVTRDGLDDGADLAAGLMTGMGKCEPPSRVTEVSPSFALGYWRGLRSAPVLAHLGEDDTDDPLGALERLERREGLTGTTLEAMRVFLHERTRATDKKRLCTFASEGVFQQRMREARRRLDAVVAG